MSAQVRMPQTQARGKGNGGQPQAYGVQAQGAGAADLGKGPDAQGAPSHRTRGGLRTDEVQHGVQTLPALWQGQGVDGLCLLRHSLQHQENGRKALKTRLLRPKQHFCRAKQHMAHPSGADNLVQKTLPL